MEHHSFPDTSIPAAYGPYSHTVIAGDFVFLSGQTARDSNTGLLIERDVVAQTRGKFSSDSSAHDSSERILKAQLVNISA